MLAPPSRETDPHRAPKAGDGDVTELTVLGCAFGVPKSGWVLMQDAGGGAT